MLNFILLGVSYFVWVYFCGGRGIMQINILAISFSMEIHEGTENSLSCGHVTKHFPVSSKYCAYQRVDSWNTMLFVSPRNIMYYTEKAIKPFNGSLDAYHVDRNDDVVIR